MGHAPFSDESAEVRFGPATGRQSDHVKRRSVPQADMAQCARQKFVTVRRM
jgi:methyl coenzyme M reductase subunit D